MTDRVAIFLKEFAKKHGPFNRVLDVGSFDVNGSVRNIIKGQYKDFIGVDMREGPGVDMVLNAHHLSRNWQVPFFDLVTCVETLEHDCKFWITIKQMRKVLKPGGWLLITAPSVGMGLHEYPNDYYRFITPVFEEIFFEGFNEVHIATESYPHDYVFELKDKEHVKAFVEASEKRPNEIFGYGRKP